MKVDIITLFPGMFGGPLSESIVGRARESGIIEVSFTNPRDFAGDRHKTVDDRPYGGGPGMILMAEPLYRALRSVRRRRETSLAVFLSPRGRRLDQAVVRRLSRKKHLILICGRYEGVDERFMEYVDEEISVGDYVLTGGEIPAMIVVDAVTRLLPGVLSKSEAVFLESFSNPALEYSQYTRPRTWRGLKVPEVLLSGNHSSIERWRETESRGLTRRRRPDLLRTSPQNRSIQGS